MDIPIATRVEESQTLVSVDSEHLAKEKVKVFEKEQKRLFDAKIAFEKMLNDERIEFDRNHEKRLEAEWRIKYPRQALERDHLEKQKKQEQQSKDREFYRICGLTLIGAGFGMYSYSFM
jgi:hypothetical protein